MFNQVAPPPNTALRRLGRGIGKTAEKLKPNEGAACAVEGSPSFQCSGSFRTGFKLLKSAIRALRSLPTCPKKRTTPDDGKVISTTTFPYGGILGPRSPSVIDFPFGGSAEDAIKEWPTLSNAATLKYVRFFS